MTIRTLGVLVLVAALASTSFAQEDGRWPVELETAQGTIVLYQPQVESFEGDVLESRGAVSITPADGSRTIFGAVWFQCHVATDFDTRIVTLERVRITASRFPDVEEARVAELSAYLESEIPTWDLEISLDRLLAGIAAEQGAGPGAAALATDPPEIVYAQAPTVLVVIDGDPILADLEGADLKYVVNSPYYIVQDPRSGRFYLKGGDHWYEAPDVPGPWVATTDLPGTVAEVARQVAKEEAESAAEGGAAEDAAGDGTGGETEEEDPGDEGPPAIVVRTRPAEILQTSGPPEMSPLEGTQLLYVSNTDSDLLFDIDTQRYWVLLAGRWYHSASLEDGEWKYAAPDELPAEFAKIPEDSDLGQVLYAVAGTQASREAALENQIPQTAEVDRKTATVTVTYDGDPEFEQCTDEVAYALNTDKSVLRVDGRYYCCDQAVWFVARGPAGPWEVASEVPPAVRDIPADCPVYNVRYCTIYDSTPEVVYVAYTPGYTGSYVYHGCVVYGTGYWYHPWYRAYYYPRPVTYGFRVHWNSATGWGFSYGMSVGWLHIQVGRPVYGGWWGPAGYRAGYRHGYYHGYHHGAAAGYRAGYRAGQANSSRNLYASRAAGVNPTTRPETRPGVRPGGGNVTRPAPDAGGAPGAKPGTRPAPDAGGAPGAKPGTRPGPDAGGAPAAKPGTRPAPDQGGSPAAKPRPSQRPNDVYADRNGHVYRDQGGNQWQKQDNRSGNWSKSPDPPSRVQRDSQARQRGNDRARRSR